MIVKVQLSISSTDPHRQILVYDKSRKYEYLGYATEDEIKLMKGRLKAYFSAKMVGTKIQILEEVEEQD